MSNKICTDIANKYTNTILKKITNVYQLQYIDFKPPGLGDYIRGCFCMMQLIYLLNKYCKTDVAENFRRFSSNNDLLGYWQERSRYFGYYKITSEAVYNTRQNCE